MPEDLIKRNWGYEDAPVVSICCTTFNHEDLIKSALDGFLMQQTTFPFEAIIRDDCSTDRTASIIQQYATKYPKIIKPIFESSNQFSKGIKPMSIAIENACGEFVALCEGDDYWTDPLKLQKQVDLFRQNPGISICFHPAIEENAHTEPPRRICKHYSKNQVVPIEDVILGRGGFMPTASIMFRNRSMRQFFDTIKGAPIGDYFIQMYLTLFGQTYYLNESMCVYRRNVEGSWTERQMEPINNRVYCEKMVASLDKFSLLFEDEDHKELIFQVIKFYFMNSIRGSRGIAKRLSAVRSNFSMMSNYSAFHYKLNLHLELMKRFIQRKAL